MLSLTYISHQTMANKLPYIIPFHKGLSRYKHLHYTYVRKSFYAKLILMVTQLVAQGSYAWINIGICAIDSLLKNSVITITKC